MPIAFAITIRNSEAVDEVERRHIAALHYRHRGTPHQANRVIDLVRKMFNLAEAWGLRTGGGNPCRSVLKHKEKRRDRFLIEEDFARLGAGLAEVEAWRRRRPWPPSACSC